MYFPQLSSLTLKHYTNDISPKLLFNNVMRRIQAYKNSFVLRVICEPRNTARIQADEGLVKRLIKAKLREVA